jgi:glutathione peroxidase-family protein
MLLQPFVQSYLNLSVQFCTVNHGVTFPLMKKSDVNGDNTNEVFLL